MANSRRDFLRHAACALGGAGLASTVESFGLLSAYAQGGAATDYRALVCVFLNGGNDGDNTIVSLDQYASYNGVRGGAGLAFPQAGLIPISPAGGGSYGLNPNLSPEVATPSTQFRGLLDVWNQGRLAVVCNTGPLVEPLTRTTYRNGTGRKPLQLFSHSDQIGLWQSSVANAVSQTGWGGRLADKSATLNGASTFPQVVSIAGISLFVTGATARPLAIPDANTSLSNVLPLQMNGTSANAGPRRTAFDELRALDLGPKLVRAAAETRTSSLQTRLVLQNVSPTLTTAFPNTSLGRQLRQVASIIALRDNAAVDVKRQIFFAQLGGFDTHSGQHSATASVGQDALLLQLGQAMRAFYDATVELGVSNNVTTFTLSDFGRTFAPSGSGSGSVGSDHGWGNHHFVMGGSVVGGRFYGTYPTLALSGPDDADSRGRWIPTTAVEQYAATLASWYGLPQGDLPTVFPLVNNFPSANLGFLA